MKLLSLILCSVLTSTIFAEISPKFGAYGNPPDSRFLVSRMAHSDRCADFVENPLISAEQNLMELKERCTGSTLPVGELEGRTSGPLANQSFANLFSKWNFLIAFKSDVPTKKVSCDFWCGLRSSMDFFSEIGQGVADLTPFYNNKTIDVEIINKIGEAAKGLTYAEIMDKLGVASDERSREAVLEKRLVADGGERLKRLILNFEKANNTKTIIFEIGNEPNLFPYIPSKLYAIYYRKWVREIFNSMISINVTRSKGNYLTPKFITGGLFIADGLPETVKSILTGFIRSAVFEVGIGFENPETYQKSFMQYLNAFSDLKNPGWKLYDAAWGENDFDGYIPLSMGFTYNYSCTNSDPCKEYWRPNNFLAYANLHFYPYTAAESTLPEITDQLYNLDRIINLTSASTEYSKAMFTEVGSLNPYSPMETSSKIVAPVSNYLKSNPMVSSFFWFKSRGYDKKFDGLNNQNKVKLLSDFAPGFVTQYFNGNIPYPALFEENNSNLTPIGCKFYEAAGYPVKLSPAGKCFWPGSQIASLNLLNN